MDPLAALAALASALDAEDYAEALHIAADLREWIARGGFAPEWSRYPSARAFYISTAR